MHSTRLNGWVAAWFASGWLVIAGCSVATHDDEPSTEAREDDELVLETMQALGFDRAHVALDGETVRVDDDMVFQREALLDGAYDYLAARAGGEHDKGYRYTGGLLFRPEDIRLVPSNIPSNLLWTVDWAGAQWSSNSAGYVSMNRSNNGTGGWIEVKMVDWNSWSSTPCQADAQGCVSSFPQFGYPPSTVYIKSKPFSHCNWNEFTFAAVLIHEFGHALGLVHPTPAQGSHIAGTAQCKPASNGRCYADSPGYDTIMKSTRYDAQCRLVDTLDMYTREDDNASIRKLYQ